MKRQVVKKRTHTVYLFLLFTVLLSATACSKKKDKGEDIAVVKKILIDENRTIKVGETTQYIVKTEPESKTKLLLEWESSNPELAEVSPEGIVTGLKAGETTIYVRVKENKSLQASSKLTITEDPKNIIASFPDEKFFGALSIYDTNNDGFLQMSELEKIETLNVKGVGIETLAGIEQLTHLKRLDCSNNKLKELDLSKNSKIEVINAERNHIRKINIAGLKDLDTLNLCSNKIEQLDISSNENLRWLSLIGNDGGFDLNNKGITSLDLSQNKKISFLNLSSLNISRIDLSQNTALEHLEIQFSGFDRKNSRPIQELDLSHNTKLKYLDCRSWNDGSGLKQLDLQNNTNLEYLNCSMNDLSVLDVSACKNLKSLSLASNKIKVLDVSNLSKLQVLYCDHNKIEKLDLRNSLSLERLRCADNQIRSLDISHTKMSQLDASKNKLQEFIVGEKVFDTIGEQGVPHLNLKLQNNMIKEIDIRGQKNLKALNIVGNNLTALDISGCNNLIILEAEGNEIGKFVQGDAKALIQLFLADNKLSGTLDISQQDQLRLGSFEDNQDLKYIKVAPNCPIDDKDSFSKDKNTQWIK